MIRGGALQMSEILLGRAPFAEPHQHERAGQARRGAVRERKSLIESRARFPPFVRRAECDN